MGWDVVIADDEAIIRMDLAECLAAAGHTVVASVGDGRSALTAIGDLRPDVAILDVRMPEMDGITVAQHVKGQVPIVLLTAFGQPEIVTQATEAGVLGYLVKPFSEQEVTAAVEVAVSRFADFAEVTAQRDALSDSLETRKLLDRAKGLLQANADMSEPDAFRWLQKAAMDRRLSVREVAQGVIDELGS